MSGLELLRADCFNADLINSKLLAVMWISCECITEFCV